MNKKAQLFDYPIITFIVVAVSLLIVGIITLKILNSVAPAFINGFGNVTGGQIAQQNVAYAMNTTINFWDKIIIAMFFFALLTLIISSFMIDTNPFWVILFIVVSFFTILFIPNIITALNGVYNNPAFTVESSQLSFLGTIKDYFGEFITGVMVLCGIIIFGKVFLFRSNTRR